MTGARPPAPRARRKSTVDRPARTRGKDSAAMFEMLRGLVDALAKTDAEAAEHREDDRTAFGVIMPALEEIKAANVAVASQVKSLGEDVAKIIPVVAELKRARDYAQTRAEVLKEIATEAAAKKEREDDQKAVSYTHLTLPTKRIV